MAEKPERPKGLYERLLAEKSYCRRRRPKRGAGERLSPLKNPDDYAGTSPGLREAIDLLHREATKER